MMDVAAADRVVAEARSWIGTPYQHLGCAKGVAVDCIMLLVSVFADAGLIARFDPRPYPRDWHLHRGVERYLQGLARYSEPIADPAAGDIATYRFGRCVSHAGIVSDADHLIHAYSEVRRVEETELATPALAARFAGYWRLAR